MTGRSMMSRVGGLLTVLVGVAPVGLVAQAPPPVLDMHLHALSAASQGPPPLGVCTPFDVFPTWDQQQPYPVTFGRALAEPTCSEFLMSPETDEEVRDRTIEVIRRNNVYGVLSGTTRRVEEWRALAPGRFVPGLGFRIGLGEPSPDSLRALFASGKLEVLAEVTNQYAGIAPDDPRMEPYWAVAEELDMPVGIHMGPGPPGTPYLADRPYRMSLSSGLLLEDVLVRHPGLRIYVMHAGFPLLDDMLALLYAHPQVHVEVGVIVFSQPREAFYRYLKAIVDAGFGERVMFGSDHMVWPEAIERSIQVIEEAPFLSPEQKRAILYDNAARFLRLSDEERARHHGR